MEIHQFYGVWAREKGWVPAPSYVLRRSRILKLLSRLPRGRLLEIGCGAGALLHDLYQMHFNVDALEASVEARDIARYINRHNGALRIYSSAQVTWGNAFDCVLACEVLEHIHDDRGALVQWQSWIKKGGYLLLSVPAHPERWTASDEWAGHVRRYRKEELKAMLSVLGFSIVHFEGYGFPLANLIEPIRAAHHSRQLKKQAVSRTTLNEKDAYSLRSGTERSLEQKLFPLQASRLGTVAMRFFCNIQGLFLNTGLGNGFIVLCQKQ